MPGADRPIGALLGYWVADEDGDTCAGCAGASCAGGADGVGSALVLASPVASAQTRPTRFWNLTRHTISEFQLAPAGTTDWGPNQCKNDKDGTVDPDERLRITGVGGEWVVWASLADLKEHWQQPLRW